MVNELEHALAAPRSEEPESNQREVSLGVRRPALVPVIRVEDPDEPRSSAELRSQLELYRQKAIHLDVLVFELRALLQSGKGFSEIMNLDPLLASFMAVCRERYGAIRSVVLLLDDLDPTSVYYRVRAFSGFDEWYTDESGQREELMMFRIPRDNGLLWQLILQGDVFSVRDMQRLPRFKTAFQRWNLDVLKSDVWVPLVRGGNVLGVLMLGECEDGSQIHESEFHFLQEIASVAATNIDSTMKYEKNARILANLRTLYDINQQLANVNDFKKLTVDTLATAVDALKAQKANLMLYNPDTGMLEIKVVWGNIPPAVRDSINEGRTRTKSFALGEGVAGMAAKMRRPVRINDKSKIEQVGKNPVYCILSVPLLYGGELMGVMTITNKVRGEGDAVDLDLLGRFGEDDAQLLLGLADQASVNLHKARLYSASITDRLTGLWNARHFEHVLEQRLERAIVENQPIALAVCDIDHFKRFNDSYGHKAGDAVLAETAALLREVLRPSGDDGAFRYGGEEFCLVLPNTSLEEARRICDDYRSRVERHAVQWQGSTLSVTVSVGIACYPFDAASRPELFEAADRALYASKEAGRNRVTLARSLPAAEQRLKVPAE